MKGMERIEESLCEKSMKVVSNVIKMSALSIAKRSLGTATVGDQVATRNSHQPRATSPLKVVPRKPLLRAQQPQTNTKHIYLVEPESGNNSNSSSSHVVKEDMNVDGRASDFIRKVREKNQKDVFVSSETSSYKLHRSRIMK